MAEIGISYTLTTPAGDLSFNTYSAGGYLRLSDVAGLDAAAVRSSIDSVPQRDGALVNDSFLGAVTPVIEGHIIAPDLATRRNFEDDLRAKLRSLLRADGILKWNPSGTTGRQRTVRLLDGPLIVTEDSWLKKFHFSLVAGDPNVYAQTVQNSTSPIYSSGTGNAGPGYFIYFSPTGGSSLIVTNAGDTTTYPTVRILGPVNGPILINQTTGQQLKFTQPVGTATQGLPIPNGVFVDVDMLNETAAISVFDGTYTKLQYLDIATSDFWGLVPGANTIHLDAVGGTGGATQFAVFWRDAWA